MSTYTMIATSSILSHENNPRKVIGDITELANSIKVNGILQHLTVVPFEDKYKVVIGHRRLAAAKKAGLKEVPCVIEEMTEEEQIRTMMMENMQREDLTAREEALGFQMMFDLGEDVKSVAKKTGFSQTTVRHRTKMLELDAEKLKASEERGAKITDYIKLEEIKDIDVRNKVLATIGTNNFNKELNSALENQKRQEAIKAMDKFLSKFAAKIEQAYMLDGEHHDMTYVKGFYTDKPIEFEPEDGVAYYYTLSSWSGTLYKDGKEEKEVDDATAQKRAAYEAQREMLERNQKEFIQLRKNFVADFCASKKYADVIRKFYFDATMSGISASYGLYNFKEIVLELMGLDGNDKTFDGLIEDEFDEAPEMTMLYIAYAIYAHKDCRNWDDHWNAAERRYDVTPKQNETLAKFYSFLCRLGYQMSDAEVAYLCGDLHFSENISG